MQKLIQSRRSSLPQQSPEKLKDLTPQKYGKGAYCQLTYTPSKLVDNVIYREVSTMKKYEGETNRLRELEALVNSLKDKIETIEQQKQGIDHSLNHQITVYKKILQEIQTKHESRVKQIQTSFQTQIHQLIEDRETQAKYSQAQKELLQDEIQRLEKVNQELNDRLSNTNGNLADTINKKQKLQIQLDNTLQKLKHTEEEMKRQTQRLKSQLQTLDRKLYNTEVEWKSRLEKQINAKDKQIDNLNNLHKRELQICENKRSQEAKMKNAEVRELRETFDNETSRLSEIIQNKERNISCLNQEVNAEKQHILEMTKKYQNQINNLAHEKSRYKEEMDRLNHQVTILDGHLRATENKLLNQKETSSALFTKLHSDIELTQINFTAEKTERIRIENMLNLELDKIRLSQNKRLVYLHDQNEILQREVRNLKDLLFESSQELQKCKEEFIKMRREKQDLLRELRDLGLENNTLQRIKIERDRDEEFRRRLDRSHEKKNYY